MTLEDIQVALGQLNMVPSPLGTPPKVEDQSTLVMSVPKAKAFIRMLSKVVSQYEANFGEVNVPEQFLVPVGMVKPEARNKK